MKAIFLNNGDATKISLEQLPPEAFTIITGQSQSSKLYAEVAHLFACIDARARGVYTLPWKLTSGSKEWRYDSTDPPPFEWAYMMPEFLYKIAFATVASGRAYMLADDPPRWALASSIKETYDDKGRLSGFKRTMNGRSKSLEVEDVIHFWYPDIDREIGPAATYPAKVAMNNSVVLRNLDKHLEKYFESGMIGAKLLTAEGAIAPNDRDEIKSWWERTLSGIRNAFEARILRGDFKVQNISDSLGDLHDGTLTKQQERNIEKAFGIPETKMSQAANLATKLQDNIEFISDVVSPHARWIAQAFNSQYLAALGYTLTFMPDELPLLQADENERSKSVSNYTEVLKNAPREFLIVAKVMGVDLDEKTRKEIEQLVKEKEERRENMQNFGNSQQDEEPVDIPSVEPDGIRPTRGYVDVEFVENRTTPTINAKTGRPVTEPSFELPETTEEKAVLHRWCKNRIKQGKPLEGFTPDHLDMYTVRTIIAEYQETGAAVDSPFLKTANEQQRNKIERQFTREIAAELKALPERFTGEPQTWESQLPTLLEPLHNTLKAMLQESARQGVNEGREWFENDYLSGTKAELVIDWSLVNQAAVRWAIQHAAELITGIDDTTRTALATEIAAWIESGAELGALVNTLQNAYAFSRSRAEAIASTEVTRAYAYANREAWKATGVVTSIQWVTANDERVCPICAPLGGLVYTDDGSEAASIDDQNRRAVTAGIDGGFVHPGGRGKASGYEGQSYELPPAHPRCRCSISPIVR